MPAVCDASTPASRAAESSAASVELPRGDVPSSPRSASLQSTLISSARWSDTSDAATATAPFV
jgi:hypothetical protein